MNDLRFALRQLAKARGLSAVIIVSLACGIGANTTVFSWLNAAIFRPLPGVTANVLCVEARNSAGVYTGTSWLEYRDLAERLPSFRGLLAHRFRAFSLGDSERGERLWGELVSANFFDVLGVQPALGRFFRADEVAAPGGAPVAVISHLFWQREFGGLSDVIGHTVKLNNRTLTIVGVAPADFSGAFTSLTFDVWLPLTMATEMMPATRELSARENRAYMLLGALRPGVTRAHAEGELAAAARGLAVDHPDTNSDIRFELLPLWRNPRGGAIVSGALATLQLFAALVLVVVCVNTMNLLLARASVRQREIGIRLACGAGPSRIIRQLLVESVLLALAGAACGAVLSLWGIDALRHVPVPGNIPVRISIALDWHGLLFASTVGITCGVLFGLAPALQLARADVQHALRGGRGVVGSRSRLRNALVATEVAVALVVLVLAGLFLKSFHNAQTRNPGYAVDRVLLASVDLVGRGYAQTTTRNFLRDVQTRLRQLPGVDEASAASFVPLDIRGAPKSTFVIDGVRTRLEPARALFCAITPGYFNALGIPLVAGTDLVPLDRDDRGLDAVINEEMARRFWPGVSPLGHHLAFASGAPQDVFEVVGVAADSKYESLAESAQPVVWLTARAQPLYTPTFHIRVRAGDPLALLPSVRSAIGALDAELTVYDGRTFAQHIDNNLFLQRTPALMLSLFGPLALALAAIGLYAVLAHSLTQRTQEIGVRLTLGASPVSVVALMVREGMKAVIIGAALGWVVSFALGTLFAKRLVAVPPGDPVVYGGVPALLLTVALFACWLPARRATRINPIEALRAE